MLPKTRETLAKLKAEAAFISDYVIVGGSALSMRLCHRHSEDLDFFTYRDKFDKADVFEFFRGKNHEIINDGRDQVDLVYNGIKLTFFNSAWDFLKPEKTAGFNVASLDQLAGMKVHTLFLRATYRDYYDLYVLSFKMSLQDMYQNALMFIEGLNYKLFSMALIYLDDIIDDDITHLSPQYDVSREEISRHFISKLKETGF
ncbi:MAG: nucleotidyl transferase AbiEii/AbiGii toxin family protein [Bacteroidota bacterium]